MEYQSYYALIVGLCGFYIISLYNASRARYKLSHIPTVGPSGTFSSYIWACRFKFNAKDMIQEGYDKYPGSIFRIPMISHWRIIVSGRQNTDDLRKATANQISLHDFIKEDMQLKYTMGNQLLDDPYHIAVIRAPLTRNIAARFPDLQDETTAAFEDLVPPSESWVKVSAYNTIVQIVCRTSNRLFVGLPLCRDSNYIKLNEDFGFSLFKAATLSNISPNFLRTLVSRYISPLPRAIKRAKRHLEPLVKERLEKEEKYGSDWPDKPNDLLSWLLEDVKGSGSGSGSERSVHDLTLRILATNLAAHHTTSMYVTGALYDLAAYSTYVPELRKEVEAIINQEGLTKASLSKMPKLDSFIKESARIRGGGYGFVGRKILQDFAFSDGTVIPAGNMITVAVLPALLDEANYKNPLEFNGFRFAKQRENEPENVKDEMVSLDAGFLIFGFGRQACPGRFFAVTAIKLIMVYILLNYDVKFEDGVRPPDQWFFSHSTPNREAFVMFRKRST